MAGTTRAIPDQEPRRPGRVRALVRGLGLILLGLFVAIVLLIAFSALMRAQTVTLPAPTGAFAVGRTELALSDTGRLDPFASDDRTRELAVWIWYPSAGGASGDLAPYLPPSWAPLVNTEVPLSQDLTAVRTNAIVDAPLDGRPPAVVLMPGLGQPVAMYSALAEDLASRGYAVVGINPTGSAPVVFPDGHLVAPTELGGVNETTIEAWYVSAAQVASVWATDAEFVVRTLTESPPQIGALNFDQVAYVGHSMGGAVAVEACSRDAACAVAVNLDGTLWTEVRNTGLEAPSLLLQAAPTEACDAFCQQAALDFENVIATGSAQRFAIAGSKHLNFTDLGHMWGPANALVLGDIDADRMTLITRDLVRSFLDVQIRGAPAATFSEAASGHPELR